MITIRIATLTTSLLVLCLGSAAAKNSDDSALGKIPNRELLQSSFGVSNSDLRSTLGGDLPAFLADLALAGRRVPAYEPPATAPSGVSNFEVAIPHKSQRMITVFEKRLLTSYLDHPDDLRSVRLLALYHVVKAQLPAGRAGAVIEHQVMADYFLSRAIDLGAREPWVRAARSGIEARLNRLAGSRSGVAQDENLPAHAAFHDAMFYHEENRYAAYDRLLDAYAVGPNNVYTSFLLGAVNLWTGGEAGYDDPTVLYNFVLGSYFSLRAMDLAHQAELAWQSDPVGHTRFRLASIIGGFSASHRRFLAKLAKDDAAVQAIDAEHRLWFEINPPFHMFTLGYSLFEEPANFAKALDAWETGLVVSGSRPDLITVLNRPRYTFNQICIFVGTMDFYLKLGDVATAQNYWASIVPYLPNYSDWDIGRDGYEQRLTHLQEIADLYQNDDAADDPVPFNVKRRKWGMNTQTCQTCHQTQRKTWSEEEKANVLLAPDDILTVGTWPEVTTTWYGRAK
jgi:hypothetical protein